MIILDGEKESPLNEYIINKHPEFKRLFELYDKNIFTFELTSVGIIIGALNAETKLKMQIALSNWIY